MRQSPLTPESCPVCGGAVPARASACPHCGADEQTGWDEETTHADGLDLPGDEAFDYDDFVAREFGGKPDPRRQKWVGWQVIALVVVLVILFLTFLGLL